jgi:hypothetical protein
MIASGDPGPIREALAHLAEHGWARLGRRCRRRARRSALAATI